MEHEDPDSIELSWGHFSPEAILRVLLRLLQDLDRPKENICNNNESFN